MHPSIGMVFPCDYSDYPGAILIILLTFLTIPMTFPTIQVPYLTNMQSFLTMLVTIPTILVSILTIKRIIMHILVYIQRIQTTKHGKPLEKVGMGNHFTSCRSAPLFKYT